MERIPCHFKGSMNALAPLLSPLWLFDQSSGPHPGLCAQVVWIVSPRASLYEAKKCSISSSNFGSSFESDRSDTCVCDSAATAMSRLFLSVFPFSVCSASITPRTRHSTRQPAKAGSSVSNKASSGSPSSATVRGSIRNRMETRRLPATRFWAGTLPHRNRTRICCVTLSVYRWLPLNSLFSYRTALIFAKASSSAIRSQPKTNLRVGLVLDDCDCGTNKEILAQRVKLLPISAQ